MRRGAFGIVIAFGLAGPAAATGSDEIRALEAGGSDAWDAEVKAHLLREYDLDRSGAIDQVEEVLAPGCAVWDAVDDGVREAWRRGFDTTYGVGSGFWLGFALGVDIAVRAPLHAELVRCGLAPPDGAGGALRSMSTGGTRSWDEAVRRMLLAAFDADGDGWLGVSEARRIPCTVWHSVDEGVREGWGAGLHGVYGFAPEAVWVGFALGFDERARRAGAEALVACGLVERPLPAAPEGPDEAPGWIRALPDGGTGRWDGAIRTALVRWFDEDGDGVLATWSEVRSPGCEVWTALDVGARQRWPDGLGAYGLTTGRAWDGWVLGLAGSARAVARDVLRGCGIAGERGRPPEEDSALAAALRRIPGAGSEAWSARTRETLLGAVDVDGSGAIDAAVEVAAVDCASWSALDAAFRRVSPVGVYLTMGASGVGAWGGPALGMPLPVRGDVADALERCGLGIGAPVRGGPRTTGAALAALSDPRGTSAWDRGAREVLVAAADRDGSGWLDQPDEVAAVPCDAWRTVDQAARARWPVGMVDRYGLRADHTCAATALGVATSRCGDLRRAARRCLEP